MNDDSGLHVLVFTWNRPLYLWVCLDSLYRYAKHPARFVLVDNGSTDPHVPQVVEGFVRRGMFTYVELAKDNSPTRMFEAMAQYRRSSDKSKGI